MTHSATWDMAIGLTDVALYNLKSKTAKPEAENELHIDHTEVMQMASADPFWAARGQAIQAYAGLERALCRIFIQMGDMRPEVAGLIFYKITNANARNSMVEKLIRQKYGNTYNLFWNSFIQQLTPLDHRRNQIVHWNALVHVIRDAEGFLCVGVALEHPFTKGEATNQKLLLKNLIEFARQCDAFKILAMMFMTMKRGEFDAEEAKSWPAVYSKPIVYPLPPDHPLLKMRPDLA